MNNKLAGISLILLGCASLWSCSSVTGKKYFEVVSFPTGATIYVNNEPRGQTDEKKLLIDFPAEDSLYTLRLEKEGFQTAGIILNPRSQRQICFFLQEAPNNKKLLDVLNNVQRTLGQLSAQMEKSSMEKNP